MDIVYRTTHYETRSLTRLQNRTVHKFQKVPVTDEVCPNAWHISFIVIFPQGWGSWKRT